MTRFRTARQYVRLIMTFTAGLWIAAAAFGQASSGNIYGTARERGGAVLPGVTITLTGVGAPHTFVTDSQGQFRFLSLSPGTYVVEGELSGFAKARRSADVAVGVNTDVDLVMTPSSSETITVTAASPVIDRRQVTSGASIDQIELKEVPSARDPWVVLQSVPGVLVDRVNIGGNKSGQQSYFVGKGVERNQTVWNLDGISSTDMSGNGGAAGFYLDFDSFQEFKVTTGSADPSIQTPGVQLDMVTKRGTNDLKGSGRYFWTGHQLQTTPSVPAEGKLYDLNVVNSIDQISEAGFEAGGPIINDRLWIWGAYARNPISTVVSGASTDYQKTDLWNYNAKINGQITPQNAAYAAYMYSNKTVDHRGLSSTRPVETSYKQTGPGWQYTAEDTHTFTPSLYVTGRFGAIVNGYHLDPVGGRNTQMYYDEDGIPHGSYYTFDQSMPQRQARLEGSKFLTTGTVNHELKFGLGYRRTPITSSSAVPGDQTYIDNSFGEVVITRNASPNYTSNYRHFYAGDTITAGNLTVTPGLRYDVQRAKNNPSSVAANSVFPDLLPAVNFAGDTRWLEWKSVSPRLGVNYALGTNLRTIAHASYSRYTDQIGAGAVGSNNPFYTIQYLYYYFDDLNGNGNAERNEFTDFDIARHVDPNNPGSPFSTGRVDYGMKPPKTDEYTLGIDREIGAAFAVGINGTYRKRTDTIWTAWEKTRGAGDFYTADDYVQSTPITGTLPNGQSYSVPFYKLKSSAPRPIYTVSTNRPDYYETYKGLELTATKRMQNHFMLRGSLTLTDWKQHLGAGSIWDPTPLLNSSSSGSSSASSCNTCPGATTLASSGGANGFINSRWATSVNGVVELPFHSTFGFAFTGREGYIIPYFRRVNNSNGFGNKRVLVSGFDQFRLPNLYDLDLRIAKNFSIMRGAGLELSADMFNTLNKQTVLWRDYRLYTATGTDLSAGSNDIQELQSPRIVRVGMRLTF
jgi:carboxypeptidase family protein